MMASRLLLWSSRARAASYLRISAFHRGFATVFKDLKYADTHEWVRIDGTCATVGITDHAQDHLGDIVYVELPEIGATVTQGKNFCVVESGKTTTDIHSPVSGEIVGVNTELSGSPSLINASPYDKGWIMKVKVGDASELNSLMDSDQYKKICEDEDAKITKY